MRKPFEELDLLTGEGSRSGRNGGLRPSVPPPFSRGDVVRHQDHGHLTYRVLDTRLGLEDWWHVFVLDKDEKTRIFWSWALRLVSRDGTKASS